MIILFSSINKAIENYKYQISTLRNSKLISEKDMKILKKNENLINLSKITCRALLFIEIALLAKRYFKSNFSGKSILFMVLRVNINWFIILYLTKINVRKHLFSAKAANAMRDINFAIFEHHRRIMNCEEPTE